MKKFAYTIAETLITLAIIGVIGAITLPTFISSHRNQTNASALSVAISNMENGLTAYLMKEGVTDLYKTQAWRILYPTAGASTSSQSRSPSHLRGFIAALEGVLNITYSTSYARVDDFYEGYDLKDINGNAITAAQLIDGDDGDHRSPNNGYRPFLSKNGVVYFINFSRPSAADGTGAIPEAQAMAAGGALTNTFASVIIDVNGTNMPNTVGRDIFKFDLGSDGILYPCGGVDYSVKNQNLSNTTWKDLDSNWTCDDVKDALGFGCTARLIDENFKPTY